jgi:mono/diheme cytochrome c family protein
MASYDSKCLQCHAKTGQPPKANQAQACTVAANDCASCHMPRYELKAAHTTMTDHFIRIVHPGEEYRR